MNSSPEATVLVSRRNKSNLVLALTWYTLQLPASPKTQIRKLQRDLSQLNRARQLSAQGKKVLIAIDVKWHEEDVNTILEIGMAMLDTRKRWPPASTWSIRVRHFIITENRRVRNIQGNKFRFNFGKSYFTSLENAVGVIQDVLEECQGVGIMLVGQQ